MTSNVRWYLITPSGQRMLDGTHEAIVLAPDKWQAREAAKVYWPTQMYTMMSVVEWEEMNREQVLEDRRRFRARRIARDAEMLDYLLTGENDPRDFADLLARVSWRKGELAADLSAVASPEMVVAA